MDCQQTSVTAL